MSQRSKYALTALACALSTLLAAPGTQAAADTRVQATGGVRTAAAPCVRPGTAAYPVEYYWKNAFGMRLGSGAVSVNTAPSLWGGQIAPGGTFTLTLAHRTAQWPLLVRSYTTTWDLSSLLAHADVVGQSGAGNINGNTLTISSTGSKTDPPQKVITFQVRQGTVGRSMTIRPTGISSVIAAPGQLGNNTPAPPIQIADGQSISPTRAADDTATTQGRAVSVPVLTNDTATAPTISTVTQPANGTATISGGNVVYTPAAGFVGTDTFTYALTTACGTATAKVTVVVPCTDTPVTLANGSFEAPPVTGYQYLPDASTNPGIGWRTTATDQLVEFWRTGYGGVPSADGQQFAELNATQFSTLYQDLPTVPGSVMTWSLYHRGVVGADTMHVLIGAPGATVAQTPAGASSPDITDGNTAWRRYTGTYIVPPGQTTTRFSFQSVSTAGGNPTTGNLLDDVVFETPRCPNATTSAVKAAAPLGVHTAN
ncbi:Ig-like domain-containing protein [Streptosporangium sp. NBC_01469]|uniref:Ig-like domain-containing protein n=1 Tax=Streptosporangium sp. NBC_01469 TaxID=2903898 RepID=UPI002E2E376E|nr:Ig-like domain-containing protein [Streptosporangium sp. NBC_01469]